MAMTLPLQQSLTSQASRGRQPPERCGILRGLTPPAPPPRTTTTPPQESPRLPTPRPLLDRGVQGVEDIGPHQADKVAEAQFGLLRRRPGQAITHRFPPGQRLAAGTYQIAQLLQLPFQDRPHGFRPETLEEEIMMHP